MHVSAFLKLLMAKFEYNLQKYLLVLKAPQLGMYIVTASSGLAWPAIPKHGSGTPLIYSYFHWYVSYRTNPNGVRQALCNESFKAFKSLIQNSEDCGRIDTITWDSSSFDCKTDRYSPVRIVHCLPVWKSSVCNSLFACLHTSHD